MQTNLSSSRFRLTALGIIILAVGLLMAYLVKTQAFERGAQYRLVGGHAYVAESDDSKQDADALQKYGGTVAVIIAAYKHKLHHLLLGGNLAYLLAIAAVILAARCFWMAWESASESDERI